MRVSVSQRLEIRLAINVGIGLLVFSIIAGLLTYSQAYKTKLAEAETLQHQLVLTVRAQAEVAAFAANNEIAQGVLEGLTANSTIVAARISSTREFKREFGSRKDANFGAGKDYPLYSPVDHLERIGTLLLVRNDEEIERVAAKAALLQTAIMLGLVLVATVIFAVASRVLVVKPLARLAREMAGIHPGSSRRLQVEPGHEKDEIGLLASTANAFLDAANVALAEVNAHRNELQLLANQDPLTGLPTMRLADDRLRMACSLAHRTGQKVALLFIDLDGFKTVNDDAGHDTGDHVLKEVARRLLDNIRADDTAARIGGDEFVVILGGLNDMQGAARVAENIVAALARPIEVVGYVAQLGGSIGIAVFPDHTGDVAAMRGIADRAMYKVKKIGKGDFSFGDTEVVSQSVP